MSSRAERIKKLEYELRSAVHRDATESAELAEQLGELRTADKYEAIIEQRIKDEVARRLPLEVGKEIAERYPNEWTKYALEERVEDLERRLTEANQTICHIRSRIKDAANSLVTRAQKMRDL